MSTCFFFTNIVKPELANVDEVLRITAIIFMLFRSYFSCLEVSRSQKLNQILILNGSKIFFDFLVCSLIIIDSLSSHIVGNHFYFVDYRTRLKVIRGDNTQTILLYTNCNPDTSNTRD